MAEKPTMSQEDMDAVVELTKKYLLGGQPDEGVFLNEVHKATSGRYGEPDGKQTMGKEEVGDIVDKSNFKHIVRGCSKGFVRGLYTPFCIKTGYGKTIKEALAEEPEMSLGEIFSLVCSQSIGLGILLGSAVNLFYEKPEYVGIGAGLLAVTNGIDYLCNKTKKHKLQ